MSVNEIFDFLLIRNATQVNTVYIGFDAKLKLKTEIMLAFLLG